MTTSGKYPYCIQNGLSNDSMWVVHVDNDQYRAWAAWLRGAFGRRHFPEPTMQVWYEWPPRTAVAAAHVAAKINADRESVNKERGWHHACSPVEQNPMPWDGKIPPAPREEERKFPQDLKPWRDILRANSIDPRSVAAHLARELDALQPPK